MTPSPEFLKALEDFDREARAEIAAAKAKPPPKPKVEATVINFPGRIIAPGTFQAILDEAQEQYLRRQRELEQEYDQSCHRGPGDPDYWRR
jgi:hypothetical protein